MLKEQYNLLLKTSVYLSCEISIICVVGGSIFWYFVRSNKRNIVVLHYEQVVKWQKWNM